MTDNPSFIVPMKRQVNSIILADDDEDDCSLFRLALTKISTASLTIVNDGEELLDFLNSNNDNLPDIIFLDLNMPRKNGMESLRAIKMSSTLNKIVVIIYSTSYQEHFADELYKIGADYYIQKPPDFEQLKSVLQLALKTFQHAFENDKMIRPRRDKFRIA